MVSSHHNAKQWIMEPSGKIRFGTPVAGKVMRAFGWVDTTGHIGGVENVDGEPATVELLPSEVLDLLEARFPGTRWFVGTGISSAA